MSIDLQGWYIRERGRGFYRIASTKRLEVIGENHSDTSFGYNWSYVDDHIPFMDQVQKVLERYGDREDDENVATFLERARSLQSLSETLGLPIRSFWL